MLDWIAAVEGVASAPNWIAALGGVAFTVAAVAIFEKIHLYYLWRKVRTGAEWQRRFPTVPKKKIQLFLTLFIKAFGFSKIGKLELSPDDRIIDIYRAQNPSKELASSVKMEMFVILIHESFRVKITGWSEDITLGELFERIVHGHPLQTLFAFHA